MSHSKGVCTYGSAIEGEGGREGGGIITCWKESFRLVRDRQVQAELGLCKMAGSVRRALDWHTGM